ncbi:MAG: asparaginase [Propionibacteriaceae bacterium]
MSPRISLLGTGGTISAVQSASVPDSRGAADLSAEGGRGPWQVHGRDVMRVSSRAIGPAEMWQLARAVEEEVAAGADGVVITHGTDTLEETAYALSLLLEPRVPVVLTGAMRQPGAPGADGPANVHASLVAAADPRLAVYGPVVVFADEVHAGRSVTKRHSALVSAFASPPVGPVATVVEERVRLLQPPSPESSLLRVTEAPAQRVELLWAVAGADGLLVRALAGQVDGLVVAGTGGGHLPPAMAADVVALVESGTPVVLASRCADGPQVLTETYTGPGSEVHLLSAGLLSGGDLSPIKCRLRLLFGLAAGLEPGILFYGAA